MPLQIARSNVRIHNGTLEALKWMALLAMTGDHINKYLFNGTIKPLFAVGRLALPLFVFVLAYNLARPGAMSRGLYTRTLGRIVVCGAISSVPFVALGSLLHGWWPANVLFTLAVITAVIYLLELKSTAASLTAIFVFVVGGALVEFVWAGVGLGVVFWAYIKNPAPVQAIAVLLMLAALSLVNGTSWALAALPLVIAAPFVNFNVPRLRWAFYSYYPIHLSVLWLIRIPMRNAGYLFF